MGLFGRFPPIRIVVYKEAPTLGRWVAVGWGGFIGIVVYKRGDPPRVAGLRRSQEPHRGKRQPRGGFGGRSLPVGVLWLLGAVLGLWVRFFDPLGVGVSDRLGRARQFATRRAKMPLEATLFWGVITFLFGRNAILSVEHMWNIDR